MERIPDFMLNQFEDVEQYLNVTVYAVSCVSLISVRRSSTFTREGERIKLYMYIFIGNRPTILLV